ncbi:MAG TPA: hypothetical protein VH814_13340 [Steroidobacteraceae bacterium]|jgi:hypothetical protein
MQRLMTRVPVAALLLAASGLLAACSSDTTTPVTPTNPVTETLTGTVSQNSSSVLPFNATAAGTVTATLATLAPLSSITVGFSLGTYSGTTCQVVLDNPAGVQGSILSGTAATAGAFCVRVYDVGNITADAPVTYTVTVVHN